MRTVDLTNGLSVRFSRSAVSDSLQPHEWQHARLLCPSPTPRAYLNSCPSWSVKAKVKSLSRVPLFVSPWTVAYQAPLSMGFSRQEYWRGVPLPSPGDLPTQGLNPGLLHCRQMLYHLSHQGRPNICISSVQSLSCV